MEGAKRVAGEVEELDTRIRHGADRLSGPIRISAPSDTGRAVVSAAVDGFLAQHPAITVELLLSDGYMDIVGQGIDLAVRYGEIIDSTMRVKRLKPTRRVACASPGYVERYGAPKTPADLKGHNCLLMRFGGNLDNAWNLGIGEMKQIVLVKGNRVSNDGALVRQWAIEGHGIALKSELDIGPDLKSGRLIELLADYAPPPGPLQILLPPGRAQPRRVRALADHLAQAIDAA